MRTKRILHTAVACLFLSMICGCAAIFQNGSESVPVQKDMVRETQMKTLRQSVEKYRSLAITYEKDQQLYKAAFLWLMVNRLMPEDPQAQKKIAALEETIHSSADRQLLAGREHAKQKSYSSARNDFLMVLAYDPNHKDALEWLKHHPETDGYILYETKQGDTMRTVAQNVYLDPSKDFIVLYFGGYRTDDPFKPGIPLKLPVIEAQLNGAEPKEPKSRQVSMPAPRIRPQASQLRPQRAYDKAGAEEHYRKGVGFFIAEDMQLAIKEWEETLMLDPEHPNARRNIEKARKFLKNGRGK